MLEDAGRRYELDELNVPFIPQKRNFVKWKWLICRSSVNKILILKIQVKFLILKQKYSLPTSWQ